MNAPEQIRHTEILDIPLFLGTLADAASIVIREILDGTNKGVKCISATSAHGLVLAKEDPEFARILRGFDINLPDGLPAVWVGRSKGHMAMMRCYGPDFFKEIMLRTRHMPIRHFFCGGEEGLAGRLIEVCRQSFGNPNCVGSFSPPFREMEESEIDLLARKINDSKAHILWLGLSTPKQERLAVRLKSRVHTRFIVTVGAAFDFHTGKVKQAPKVVQRLGLEWLFRMIQEPKRLIARYAYIVPRFLYYAVNEVFINPKR